MTDEVVGSARVTIIPDTTGFESALLNDLRDALDVASQAITDSFKDAANVASTSLADIGVSGFDPVASAAESAGASIGSTFDGVAGAITGSLDSAATDADASLAGIGADAGASIASTFDGVAGSITGSMADAASTADASLQDIGAGVTVDIPVELDTTDADQQVSDLSDTINTLSQSSSGASSDIESLSSGTSALSNVAEIGAGNISGLSGLVSGLGGEAKIAVGGVAAVATVVGGLAESGIRAIESQQRFNTVFGQFADSITHVNVGTLNGDLSTLATSLGSSTGKIRDADTAIGQFGIASGRSQQEVAKTAEQIDALALRVRALNPSLGDAGTIAEGLTSALAKGGRAAGNYGIALTAPDIQARALALGLADASGNIDQFAKLTAGASLAADRLGATLGGDVASGADNLSIRLDRLKVSFSSTASEFGKPIAEPVVELLEKLAPLGIDVERVLGDVAQSLIPVITLLADLAGAVEPVVHFISDLNPDLIGLAAGATAAAAGLGEIGAALTTELSAANPILAGFLATIGLVVVAVSAFKLVTGANDQKVFTDEVKKATSALEDENGILRLTTDSVTNYIDTTSRFSTRNQVDDLQRLGQNNTALAEQLEQGATGLDNFVNTAKNAGEITRVFDDGMGHLSDSTGHVIVNVEHLKDVNGELFTGNTDLITSFQQEQAVLTQTATNALKAAQANGAITDAQAKAALSSKDQITAYNELRIQIDEHAQKVKDLTAKYQPFVDATLAAGGAIEQLTTLSPKLGGEVLRLGDHTGSASLELVQFAQDAGAANLSAKDLGVAAAALGTDADHLKGFIDGANKALDDFASKAVGALPTASDAFKKMGDDIAGTKIDESKILSPAEFTANLKAETASMAGFVADLKRLTDAGFGDLAGTIAEQGPEIGGSLADSLVTALDHGNTLLVQNANKALTDFNSQWQFNVTYLQTVLGPQFILQSGLVASLASSAFGDNLDFAQATTLATGLAGLALDTGGKAVVAIAFSQGTEAAFQYGVGVAGMTPATVQAALDSGAALIREGPGANGQAHQAGLDTGTQYSDGVLEGLQLGKGRIGQSVAQIANNMLLTGQGVLRTGSPSKAARDLLGIPFGQGIAEGVDITAALTAASVSSSLGGALDVAQQGVVSAAEAITRNAAANTSVSSAVGQSVLANAAATSGVTGGTIIHVGGVTVPVSLSGDVSDVRAAQVGTLVGDAAAARLAALANRQVAVEARVNGL